MVRMLRAYIGGKSAGFLKNTLIYLLKYFHTAAFCNVQTHATIRPNRQMQNPCTQFGRELWNILVLRFLSTETDFLNTSASCAGYSKQLNENEFHFLTIYACNKHIRQTEGVIRIPCLSCFSRGSHKQEICIMVNTIHTRTHRIAPMFLGGKSETRRKTG